MIVIGNILTCMPSQHLPEVLEIDDNLLKSYLEVDRNSDKVIIMNILDTIEHFCKLDVQNGAQGQFSLLYRLEIAGGLDLLEELQMLPNQDIYTRVLNILENYVGVDESETMTV